MRSCPPEWTGRFSSCPRQQTIRIGRGDNPWVGRLRLMWGLLARRLLTPFLGGEGAHDAETGDEQLRRRRGRFGERRGRVGPAAWRVADSRRGTLPDGR